MRRTLSIPLTLAAALAAGACRSPFGEAPPPEKGPDAGKVGRGIHGWPLFEQAPHGEGRRTDVLWPAYSSIATAAGGLNSTGVLMPLFLFESEGDRTRTGVLRPVFDLETAGDDTFDLDVLWPLVKWVDAPGKTERRFAPFYSLRDEGDAGERHIWPFYGRMWNGDQEKQWVLAPLFSHERRVDDEDPRRDIDLWDVPWPLVRFGHAGREEQLHILPLLWHESSPAKHATVVFPFIWDVEDSRSRFEMIFPLYARQDDKDGDGYVRSFVPPLYIQRRDAAGDHTALAAGLVGWRTSDDSWSAHAFPVLWLERHEDGDGHTHLWPLFGWKRRGDTREASTIWPLFTYEWGEDSWDLNAPWPLVNVERSPGYDDTTVWPLFSHETRKGAEGAEHTEGSALLFLSTWESSGEDERDFRVLWKLVESTRHAGKSTFVINPLLRHETNDDGDSYWSFLFGLVSRKQEQGEVDWSFLWFL